MVGVRDGKGQEGGGSGEEEKTAVVDLGRRRTR